LVFPRRYHDHVLGENHAGIEEAFEEAVASGRYVDTPDQHYPIHHTAGMVNGHRRQIPTDGIA
jgi:hypothetical protein